MIVDPEPPDSVLCGRLETYAGGGQPGQGCRTGHHTAFVACKFHAEVVLYGLLGELSSLHGQCKSLSLVLMLNVQAEIVDKKRRLNGGANSRDAKKTRAKC
jgi:hypothetical protein